MELREEDHNPMHVHITGPGTDATISLEDFEVTHGEIPRKLLKKILIWVIEHREELIEEWKKWNK